MAPPRRGEAWRRHGRRLLLLALASLGALPLPASGVADEPTVEPAETSSGFAWKPSAVTAAPGGTVAFRNPGAVVPHGVHWTGGPDKPSCSGVPVDDFGTSWSGSCTFAQAGTYTFVCTVHPDEMKGTVTVASGEAPPPESGQPSPLPEGPAVEALRLARRQHGGAVRGSVTVSEATVGGRLAIELRARRAALGGSGKDTVRVGKLARALAAARPQHFVVRLQPAAKRALQRRGSLSVVVKTVVTPPGGPKTTMTRMVMLSA